MKLFATIFALVLVLGLGNVSAASGTGDSTGSGVASVNLTEAKYDRLMRIYVNKIKLAFVQPEEAQTLEMLQQYAVLFAQQTDALKTELALSVKDMPKADVEALYRRLSEKSRGAELMALMYDERVAGRLASNAEIRKVMENMQVKSQEIQKSSYLAAK